MKKSFILLSVNFLFLLSCDLQSDARVPVLSKSERDEYQRYDQSRTSLTSFQKLRKNILIKKGWTSEKLVEIQQKQAKAEQARQEASRPSATPAAEGLGVLGHLRNLIWRPAQPELQQSVPPSAQEFQEEDDDYDEQAPPLLEENEPIENFKPTGRISRFKAFVFREKPVETKYREMLESVKTLGSKRDVEMKNIENIWGDAANTKSCFEVKLRIAQQYEQQITTILDRLTKIKLSNEAIISDYADKFTKELDDAATLVASIQQQQHVASIATEFTPKQIVHILKWAFAAHLQDAKLEDIIQLMQAALPKSDVGEQEYKNAVEKFITACLTNADEQAVFMDGLSKVTADDLKESVALFKDVVIDFFSNLAIGAPVKFKEAVDQIIKLIKNEWETVFVQAFIDVASDPFGTGIPKGIYTITLGAVKVAFKAVRVILTPLIALGRYALAFTQLGRSVLAWVLTSEPMAYIDSKQSLAYVRSAWIDEKDAYKFYQNKRPAEFKKALEDALYEKRSLKANTGPMIFKPAEQLAIIDKLWQGYSLSQYPESFLNMVKMYANNSEVLDEATATNWNNMSDEQKAKKMQEWFAAKSMNEIIAKGLALQESQTAGLGKSEDEQYPRINFDNNDLSLEDLIQATRSKGILGSGGVDLPSIRGVMENPENKDPIARLRILKILADIRQKVEYQAKLRQGIFVRRTPEQQKLTFSEVAANAWALLSNFATAIANSRAT